MCLSADLLHPILFFLQYAKINEHSSDIVMPTVFAAAPSKTPNFFIFTQNLMATYVLLSQICDIFTTPRTIPLLCNVVCVKYSMKLYTAENCSHSLVQL